MPRLGIAPRLLRPQRKVLLLYYLGNRLALRPVVHCGQSGAGGHKNFGLHVASRLAQLVERKTFNLVVVGSSPTVGGRHLVFCYILHPAASGRRLIFKLCSDVAKTGAR